ncbi:MAG: diaminopimelate decarboxylase [Hyphomicrobiales bacterium]|nr:diaminopimelate decarboxylase [Hyphomicrobiales bacterium]
MSPFSYRDGVLHAEGVDLRAITREVGTPFYCYARAALTERYKAFNEAFAGVPHLLCFAMKTNSNQAVLTTLARLGAGMDVVSGGEIMRARAAGVPGERIVFSGVGKTRAEMALALRENILCFNVESEPELEALSGIASAMGVTARISVRVNPDVDALTHAKISTGTYANKFGVPISEAPRVYARAAALPGIEVTGVDMHIGSQIVELAPIEAACTRLADLARQLIAAGHRLTHIDVGGGLGVRYRADDADPPGPQAYAETILRHLGALGLKLIFEHGRLIAANAGILVSEVLYVKKGAAKTFVIVDAAMNDLVRPTLYEAWHEIVPVIAPAPDALHSHVDVVGPVCESGDYLAQNRALPPLKAGDLIGVLSAGAYGAVQAGTYNTRPLVPEVMVDGTRWATIRARPPVTALIDADNVPSWLAQD